VFADGVDMPSINEVARRLDELPHQLDEVDQTAGLLAFQSQNAFEQSIGIAHPEFDDLFVFGIVRQAVETAAHSWFLLNVRVPQLYPISMDLSEKRVQRRANRAV
jgi:hypothetical protein